MKIKTTTDHAHAATFDKNWFLHGQFKMCSTVEIAQQPKFVNHI